MREKEAAQVIQGIDELTGLDDQAGFEAAAEGLLRAGGRSFCLIYWNVRQLRVINDLLGRRAGDEVLMSFAQRLRTAFSGQPAAHGRAAQDRFLSCVPLACLEGDRWRQLLTGDLSVGQGSYNYSVCCGLYRVEGTDTPVRIMTDKAHMAMHRARASYAEPYAWFEEAMWEEMVREHQLNADFANGLRQGQFEVYYQPICRAIDGRIQSCEALVRWNHPERGLLSPDQFIGQFEGNGFIGLLDRYVWDQVCRTLGERLARGERVVPVGINVSRLAFYDARAFEDLWATAQKYRVPPKYLRVEITESAYVGDPAPVRAAIDRLHELGFTVLMDDFGSGYSSLSTLKDYPVDVLKVDRVFLQQLDSSSKAQVILESVVRMAQWMQLQVIVEGVETRAQWAYLRSIACDLVQGSYFHPPMPQEDFAALLQAQGDAPADPPGPGAGDVVNLRCPDTPLHHLDEQGHPLCELSCPLFAAMADGQFHRARVLARHRAGHRIALEVTALPWIEDGQVRGAVELFTQASPEVYEERTVAQLSKMAMRDDLTHLPNRRYLESYLAYQLAQFQRTGQGLAVLFADIDDFSRFNNQYGHHVGDQVLIALAQGVAQALGRDDRLGRWGGEAFVGVHALARPEDAAALGEQFRRIVQSVCVEAPDGSGPLHVSVSVGVAAAQPGDSAEDLIARADQLMYQAKGAGKDQVRVG